MVKAGNSGQSKKIITKDLNTSLRLILPLFSKRGEKMLIVKAKIKDVAGSYNVAGDLAEELNKKVEQLIKDAVARAEANGRKTVMAKDL